MERSSQRFRYLLRPQKYEELESDLEKDFPGRDKYHIYQIQFFLRTQGFHLQQSEIVKLVQKMYSKTDDFITLKQAVGLFGRLSIDEQVETDFRKIFEFFSGGDEYLTAQELKAGLARLGDSMKERDVNQIFIELDLNFNGYISFETFLEAIVRD